MVAKSRLTVVGLLLAYNSFFHVMNYPFFLFFCLFYGYVRVSKEKNQVEHVEPSHNCGLDEEGIAFANEWQESFDMDLCPHMRVDQMCIL